MDKRKLQVKKVAKVIDGIVHDIRVLDFEPHMTSNWRACDDTIQVGQKYYR